MIKRSFTKNYSSDVIMDETLIGAIRFLNNYYENVPLQFNDTIQLLCSETILHGGAEDVNCEGMF